MESAAENSKLCSYDPSEYLWDDKIQSALMNFNHETSEIKPISEVKGKMS